MARYVPKFKPKASSEDKFINILLLGETGAGKSTFINSFVNYLLCSSLEEAQDLKLTCLIPTKFSVVTEDGDSKVLTFGEDKNEDEKLGNSSTQAAKAYVFPYESKMIRLIDTPGINDSRGAITKDRENFENILEYIGQFTHLHAVCFLLKPDVTVLTAAFKYCLIELFSRLDRSAAANIAFLFTRTCGTGYKAPDTIQCIRRILDDIAASEKVTIPLRFKGDEQKNCFYYDNECFKYLVARKQGVQMGNAQRMQESWAVSYASSWALIHYILGDEKNPPLPPHNVQDTVSVNKARLLIFELAKPLADITELVQDNLDALKGHQAKIAQENLSAEDLKQLMYVPTVDLEETQLAQPVTICAASKCAEIHTVAGVKKYHYKQRCHNPCYLNGITKDVIGDAGLVRCSAMGGSTKCRKCGCAFTTHMHVYYETRTVESRIEDKTVQSQLATNAQIIKAQYDCIKSLQKRVDEYQTEHKEISHALAIFAYFLHNNSICPINDAYEAYLDCLIQREKIAFGSNKDLLQRYESLKREHIEQKRLIEEAGKIARAQQISHVTSAQVISIWERLKKLPHTGRKVSNLHKLLTERKHGELLKNMEYVHDQVARAPKKVEANPTPVSDATGATKKKPKKKKGKDGLENDTKLRDTMENFLAKDDYIGAIEYLTKCQEESERKKKADEKQEHDNQQIMELLEQFGGLLTSMKAQQTETDGNNTGKQNPQRNASSGQNRGRGDPRFNQNQGRNNQNRGSNNQNQGSNNHQSQRGFNQNQGNNNHQNQRGFNQSQTGHNPNRRRNQFDQNQGFANQNQGQYRQNSAPYNQNQGPYNQNQGPYNQNQGPYNQNQGPYNQNQGPVNNQNPGPYNQNQGPFNPNQGPYNYNQGPYNQHPGSYNQGQYNYNPGPQNPQFNRNPSVFYNQQFSNPEQGHTGSVTPMSYGGTPGKEPVQVNINVTPNPKVKIEPLMSKYLDPPPAYSNIVDDNVHVRRNNNPKPRQPQQFNQQQHNERRAQFKKPSPRKHVPNTVVNDNKQDKEVEDENGSDDDASLEEMKKFLEEQRRKQAQETSTRPNSSAQNTTRTQNNDDNNDTLKHMINQNLMKFAAFLTKK